MRTFDHFICSMFSLVLFGMLAATNASSTTNSAAVLSHHNDQSRTGANLEETALNTRNVNSNQFGRICMREVDDEIHAQPLIMTNVDVPGKGTHNLVVVATANDSVYAFDADDFSREEPYWHTSFLSPGIVPPRNKDMTGACDGNYVDFSGNIGIVGTPVIDAERKAIYVVARTKEQETNFVQKLHALNLRDGSELPNSPVTITASCPGTAVDATNHMIAFDPLRHNQRTALALVRGVVYAGWASHCDWGPYHGWLIGYDADTLKQVAVYNTTPDGENGGIWMSAEAPAADNDGNLFITVGNGSVGSVSDPRDLTNRGESLLKLSRSGNKLTVKSWFTPCNWRALNEGDLDFGSSGVLLIPGSKLAVSCSKEGKLYVFRQDHLGGLSGSTNDTNIVQSFQVTPLKPPNNIHGTPAYWLGPSGAFIYVWGESDYLRQYQLDKDTQRFKSPEFARSPTKAPIGMPGGFMSVSADGSRAGSGILWGSCPLTGDANHDVRPGILHAYDAENVGRELWNSEQVPERDSVGNFAKFCPPSIANGKVYLATFSKRLCIYGILPGK
jgi:hypothetical protein